MFYLPCDKFLALCGRWHILKEVSWRKGCLLLVGCLFVGCQEFWRRENLGSRSWSFFTLHIMTRCSNSNLVDQGWIEMVYIEVLHIFLIQNDLNLPCAKYLLCEQVVEMLWMDNLSLKLKFIRLTGTPKTIT